MEAMDMRDFEAALEGILFAAGEPVALDRICQAVDADPETVE